MTNSITSLLVFILGMAFFPKAIASGVDTLRKPPKDTIKVNQSTAPVKGAEAQEINPGAAVTKIEGNHSKAESFMPNRVAFFEDFVNRFNQEQTPKDSSKVNRVTAIEQLFDNHAYRTGNQKKEFQLNKSLFIESIDSIYLKGDSRLPFAQIESEVTYAGKKYPIKLYLKKFLTNGVFDWKVIGVESSFITPKNDVEYVKTMEKDTAHFAINPQAHETNFLSLRTLFTKPGAFFKTIPANFRNDGSLLFLSKLIDSKQIEFDDFDINLFVNTQKGWLLKLNYQSRDTDNSGWLISDLLPTLKKTKTPEIIYTYIKNQGIN